MSLEIKAAEAWQHLQTPTFDSVRECTFDGANGLQIFTLNGRRKGLYGPAGLYVLIDHQVDKGSSFTEVVFTNLRGVALPTEVMLRTATWNNLRIVSPDNTDVRYPANSLVVGLNPGEWVGLGQRESFYWLRIANIGEKTK